MASHVAGASTQAVAKIQPVRCVVFFTGGTNNESPPVVRRGLVYVSSVKQWAAWD
jgi:hypothetical protein